MNVVKDMGTTALVLVHNVKTLTEMLGKFKEYVTVDGKPFEPGAWYGKKKVLKEITVSTHDSFVNA